MEKNSVSMKLLIDSSKGKKRVLFAEAGKDCVDFLFHILSLPIATLVRLLQEQAMEGSLSNLYQSLENLDNTYIQPNINKDTFLNPVVPVSCTTVPLLTESFAFSVKTFYGCPNMYSCSSVSDTSLAVCQICKVKMTRELTYVSPPAAKEATDAGGLVKGVVTYMVMDDLVVKPMSTISSLTLLNTFKVKDVCALEEKVVEFGMNEAVKLLKASLDRKTVLTDVFC